MIKRATRRRVFRLPAETQAQFHLRLTNVAAGDSTSGSIAVSRRRLHPIQPDGQGYASAFGGTFAGQLQSASRSQQSDTAELPHRERGYYQSYYLYGALKDLSYNFGFDADYAVAQQVTFFAEYSHERYYKRMITRIEFLSREPRNRQRLRAEQQRAGQPRRVAILPTMTGEHFPRTVDIYTVGADAYFGKSFTSLRTTRSRQPREMFFPDSLVTHQSSQPVSGERTAQ